MNRRKFWSLDLDINEVVYIRRDGKIVAAKYRGFRSSVSGYGAKTIHEFYRADGNFEKITFCCGCLNSISSRVFFSIEDAIHDLNYKEPRCIDITEMTKDMFCWSHVRTCIGGRELGRTMWRWDGYQPQEVHVSHFDYVITWDGEWGCEYTGKKTYYQTKEECLADNHVGVVAF